VDRDPQRLLRPTEGWKEGQKATGPSGNGPVLHMPHRLVINVKTVNYPKDICQWALQSHCVRFVT